MTSAADASGVSTSIVYDSADRLSTVQTSGGPYSQSQTTTYTYYTRSNTSVPNPPVGQLYSENFSSGSTNFTTYLNYDAANRLYQVSDPFTGTVVNGNPFGTGQAVTTYLYDSVGRMTQRTDPSGLTWIRCYDTNSGLVTAQYVVNGTESCASPPSSPAQSSVYGYDPGGNVVYDKETVQNSTANGENDYTYDPANRLGTYNPPSGTAGGKQTYTYDGSGNRIGVAFATGTTNSTATAYDTRGLPSSFGKTVNGVLTTTYYCYDAAGNLIDEGIPGPNPPTCPSAGSSGGVTGATKSYNYDAWNRMSTSKIGSTSYSYSYDALYRLVSSSAPSVTFSYAGSSADPIEQQASSTIYYAYSSYGPLAQGTPGSASSANYFLKDFHGDVVGLANNAGGSTSVSGWSSYDPWGTVIASGTGSATLGFQGQLTDSNTKFVKTATRFYDPAMGAFTAQDALFGQAMDPNSLNQYAYGNDSPVAYDDPTGLEHGCHGTTCGSTGADTGPGSQQQAFCDLHPTARSCQDFIPPPPAPASVGGGSDTSPPAPLWTQGLVDALMAGLAGIMLPVPASGWVLDKANARALPPSPPTSPSATLTPSASPTPSQAPRPTPGVAPKPGTNYSGWLACASGAAQLMTNPAVEILSVFTAVIGGIAGTFVGEPAAGAAIGAGATYAVAGIAGCMAGPGP